MWPAMQATGKPPGKMGRGHPNFCPYQTFEAKDADVAIACLNDRMFRNLAVTIGQPELADDPNFATNAKRVENRPETEAIVEAYVSSRTAQEVADAMRANGVPATPVNTLDKVKGDPQVEALGGMLTVDQPGVGEIELAHQALWFDGERAEAEGPAPKIGESTASKCLRKQVSGQRGNRRPEIRRRLNRKLTSAPPISGSRVGFWNYGRRHIPNFRSTWLIQPYA